MSGASAGARRLRSGAPAAGLAEVLGALVLGTAAVGVGWRG
ncbi:hypothetical protein [Ralstonia mannitolilytica]|nr:hypothetical protein [Ralstonia mannitolilytica]